MEQTQQAVEDHDPFICDCPCHEDFKHGLQKEMAEKEKQMRDEADRKRRMELMRIRQQLFESKTPPKGLLLVRTPADMLQRFLNSICSRKSVLKVYGGKTYCYAKDFKCLSGNGWDGDYSLGMITFDNFKKASEWFRSDTVCNQHDWLGGTDILTLPMRHSLKKKGYNFCSIGTFFINDPEIFYEDFINTVLPEYKKAGAIVVAASPAIEKFRGIWDTGYVLICQWKSEDDFFKYFNSGATTKTDSWCMESSCGCMTLADLETNIPASASYKRPPVCQHPH